MARLNIKALHMEAMRLCNHAFFSRLLLSDCFKLTVDALQSVRDADCSRLGRAGPRHVRLVVSTGAKGQNLSDFATTESDTFFNLVDLAL